MRNSLFSNMIDEGFHVGRPEALLGGRGGQAGDDVRRMNGEKEGRVKIARTFIPVQGHLSTGVNKHVNNKGGFGRGG